MSLCLLLAPAARGAERTLQVVMQEAAEAREAGDLQGTVVLLREAYAIRPAPQTLNNLGRILEDLGRYDEAIAAYQKVADDPDAPGDLRELDAQRMHALQRKMGKAWLLTSLSPESARLRLNGALSTMPGNVEHGIAPGPQSVEVDAGEGGGVMVGKMEAPAHRRTHWRFDLSQMGSFARVELDAGATRAMVDGARIHTPLSLRSHLWVQPGDRTFILVCADGRARRREIQLTAGATLSMTKLLEVAEEVPIPMTLTEQVNPQANAHLATHPQPVASAGPWPLATAAAGGLALGLGVALLMQSSAQEESAAFTDRNGPGAFVGPTADPRDPRVPSTDPLTDGNERDSGVTNTSDPGDDTSSTDDLKRRAAVGALVVGGIAVVGGVTWHLLSRSDRGEGESDAPTARVSPTLGGVAILGRF